MSQFEDFLAHHGIKGMRWGVRRSGLNTGKIYFEKDDGTKRTNKAGFITKAPKRKAPTSADFKKAQAAKKKVGKGRGSSKTKALSNEELQSLVKRMNLEKQYAELSARDKKKVVGAKFVGDVLQNIGKTQATNIGNQIVKDQINNLVKNARKK